MTKEIFASYRDFYRHQLLDDCIPFWEHSDLLDRFRAAACGRFPH